MNAKVRKSTEMNILSDYGNMDVMLGDGNSNSIERELDNVMNRPGRLQNFFSLPNKGSSSQENEIRNIEIINGPIRQNEIAESIEILSS